MTFEAIYTNPIMLSYMLLWITGIFGWVFCYFLIEWRWVKRSTQGLGKAKKFQLGFEIVARAFLFLYLFSSGILIGGYVGMAVLAFSAHLLLQSILNTRNFFLFSFGLSLFVAYLALLVQIKEMLHL